MRVPAREDSGIEGLNVIMNVRGILLPSWVAVLALAAFLGLGVAVIIQAKTLDDAKRERAEFFHQQKRERSEELRLVERELRLLALHTQDLQAVLIRSGLADRSDFPGPLQAEQPTAEEK